MTVHKARHHTTTSAIDYLTGCITGQYVIGRAYCDDAIAADGDGALGILTESVVHCEDGAADQEKVCLLHDMVIAQPKTQTAQHAGCFARHCPLKADVVLSKFTIISLRS
jgi:hypothetical protein